MNGGNQEMGISYFFGFFDPGLSAEPRVSRGRKAVGVRTKNRLDAGRGVAAFASFWPSPEYSGISYMFRQGKPSRMTFKIHYCMQNCFMYFSGIPGEMLKMIHAEIQS